jgi:sodium-dependent dicarboxylate transporter 2/3/5
MDTAAPSKPGSPGRSPRRGTLLLVGTLAVAVIALLVVPGGEMPRAAVLIGAALVLWLTEATPPFVPTLLLVVATPLVLGDRGAAYRLPSLLHMAADPVLALFFGGFALGAAASRHAIDRFLASLVVAVSRGRQRTLVILAAGTTAILSMWMSNIAAAAMMLAAVRPLLAADPDDLVFRRALLLGVALGANFGGMATPIGTGPNAIAIAAVADAAPITFVHWMLFALPLTVAMVALGLVVILWRYRASGTIPAQPAPPARPSAGAVQVMVVFAACVAAWLTEPLHGVPAALIALAAAAALFATGLLRREELASLDWSTLFLIAGGILLGRLMEASGLVAALWSGSDASAVPIEVQRLGWVLASAALSAVMSNTATATFLIPLAHTVDPGPVAPILVAIGASMGVPFVISTPPNAMIHGEGGIRGRDLLAVGLPLMLVGVIAVALTGALVLDLAGVR